VDKQQAKAILHLYRRGLDDDDPQFEEALAKAHADPDLAAWLVREGEVNSALRRKFREIPIPGGLLEKLRQQRPAETTPAWSAARLWRLAAVLAVLCGLAIFWLRPAPRSSFAAYERYLANLVSHPYRMSLETSDPHRIRAFLANNQAPADYAVHPSLAQSEALGCATLSWSGNPVSMLCFKDKENRKLFLFVVNRSAIPDSPRGTAPTIRQEGGFAVAGWAEGNCSYVLAVEGDESALAEFL
jgi:hypothetical protein